MEEQNSTKNRSGIIIIILGIIIAILLVWMFVQRSKLNGLVQEKEYEKVVMQKELDSLITEHNKIKKAYGSLSDSLKAKDSIIQTNAIEIRKLLDTQWEYDKVRKRIGMLQKIAQGYVQQIDSLYTINHELQAENEKIRQDFRSEQNKNTALVKDKEELNEKVNNAAVLKAYNVSTMAMKLKGGNKEQPTDKASRTERLKICFTIGENPLVKSGRKIVIVRITRPDGVVVTKTKYDTFTFNGQTLPYSLREDISYEGKAMNVCVTWNKKDSDKPAMKGKYTVSVFTDDKEIGTGSFELK
jgi:hypothetical protein